jgi:S1-C subfamily serine protease/predicted esterase
MRQPILILTALLSVALPVRAQDVNGETETSMKAAVAKVAACVVRIETSGGQDMVVWSDGANPIRKIVGPTTGLIVDADGYIITSSFNFVNKPTDIFVTIPGKQRSVAKVVAADHSRMLTLLKTDVKGLPVPTPTPKKDFQVGQWSLALGRALNPDINQPPSMSAGIISAVGRIWGKAIQCDGKISPVNYGGPIIDIQGRVQGVLVPASPMSEGDTAGIEWYDSGIGFAIPLEDINRVLPKLKAGTPEKHVDLRAGLFGIPQPAPPEWLNPPVLKTIIPDSAADEAKSTGGTSGGIKANDQVMEVDGKPIHTMAQFLHAFKPLYEGDSFTIKVKRGDKMETFKVTLKGSQASFETGFLGILPMRDDPDAGVEIRYVYPDSPAAKAGLKVGDRIMQIGTALLPMRPFNGRNQFAALMHALQSGTVLEMEVKRKDGGKTDKLSAKLVVLPDTVPAELPKEKASKERAREQPKDVKGKGPKKGPKEEPKKNQTKKEESKKDEKVETGKVLQRTNETTGAEYWIYIPRGYKPDVSCALLVWLHAANRAGRDADDMMKIWDDFCDDHQIIMMGPVSRNKDGWVPSEADDIVANMNVVLGQYTIDRERILMHGHGIGGQMAYYMSFHARDLVRGAATVSSVLATQLKDSVPNQRLQFLIYGGEKDLLINQIKDSKTKLIEKKYNVMFRQMKNIGKQYFDDDSDELKELVRWIDTLDRQ